MAVTCVQNRRPCARCSASGSATSEADSRGCHPPTARIGVPPHLERAMTPDPRDIPGQIPHPARDPVPDQPRDPVPDQPHDPAPPQPTDPVPDRPIDPTPDSPTDPIAPPPVRDPQYPPPEPM